MVLLTVRHGAFSVLLVERDTHPFRGDLALPGGFVQPDEDLEAAAVRRLERETGVRRDAAHVEQLGAFGAPDRDPRMRVVSVAYLVFAPDLRGAVARRAARARCAWVPVDDVDTAALAFDHERVLAAGVERARAKLEYTPLAAAFVGEQFTVGELRRVYEAVWGHPLDPRNFHRKVTGTPDFLRAGRASRTGRPGGRTSGGAVPARTGDRPAPGDAAPDRLTGRLRRRPRSRACSRLPATGPPLEHREDHQDEHRQPDHGRLGRPAAVREHDRTRATRHDDSSRDRPPTVKATMTTTSGTCPTRRTGAAARAPRGRAPARPRARARRTIADDLHVRRWSAGLTAV